jgi:hypothetical protein
MMGWLAIVSEVLSAVLPSVISQVKDYVEKVKNGEDVTDHWVRSKIPDELQTEMQDKILTQARKDAGLPV